MPRIVSCPCGHPLGALDADRWVLRHRHRAWTLLPGVELHDAFEAVECDACRLPYPVAALDVHDYAARVA